MSYVVLMRMELDRSCSCLVSEGFPKLGGRVVWGVWMDSRGVVMEAQRMEGHMDGGGAYWSFSGVGTGRRRRRA